MTQNDIISIYSTNGDELVKYFYDAWGNFTTQIIDNGSELEYTKNESIARLNPFRYRSYCYDEETNLYYLNSRYYDPETSRFINADDISALNVTQIATNGLNLFAYCLNNPVNETDENGDIPNWLKWLIGAVVIVVAAVATVVTAGGFAAAGAAFAGVFTGVAVSGAAGFFASVTVGAVITAGISAVGSGFSSLISGGSFWDGAADGFMWGAVTGAISGAFGFMKFKGVGDLHNTFTGLAVGNAIQSIGQSVISFVSYMFTKLSNNETPSIMEALFATGSGFVAGLVSYVPYQTQFIMSALSEIATIALTALKKVAKIPQNKFI